MRLTASTDYAFRVLMYLSVHDEQFCTIQEIADAYGISKNHLTKVAQQLGHAGYIETMRGRGGGLRLAWPPEQIFLGEVVRDVEEDLRMVECFDKSTDRCTISSACKLKKAFREALDAYLDVLDGYSIADLLKRPKPLKQLLGIA